MKKDELIKIAKNFSIDGEPVKIEKCNSGHINKTYAITYKTKEDARYKQKRLPETSSSGSLSLCIQINMQILNHEFCGSFSSVYAEESYSYG